MTSSFEPGLSSMISSLFTSYSCLFMTASLASIPLGWGSTGMLSRDIPIVAEVVNLLPFELMLTADRGIFLVVEDY